MTAVAAFALATGTMRADLGDTYATSLRRFGKPIGTYDHAVWWNYFSGMIGQVFYRNQCVAIMYVPPKGERMIESEMWKLLLRNSNSNATWEQYGRTSDGCLEYSNQDASLYALLTPKGMLRICYTSYLRRHGLIHPPSEDGPGSETAPPVEDTEGGDHV